MNDRTEEPSQPAGSSNGANPTAKQVALLERLLRERAIPDAVAVDPAGIERISRREASALIDALLAQPKADSFGANSGQALAES